MVTIKPIEHFKELVSTAVRHQKIRTNEQAEFYLSSLLASFAASQRSVEEPLALTYLKALGATREVQLQQMKQLGDLSLFISGFFSDSLKRKLVDLDYYMNLGVNSYGFVASMQKGTVAELFDELAKKFCLFVDVLTEVSERSRLTSSVDVLRIYERWLRTRSRLAERMLREMGIEPQDTGTRPIH